jgi:ADP-heptose:LPS heptosyltransferase
MRKRLEPGERAGVEQLRAAAIPARVEEVDRILVPRLQRAGLEIGWIAKVVNIARARRAEATSTSERDRREALHALRRATKKFLGWHHKHVHPDFGSRFYPVVKALHEDLSKPDLGDALTIQTPAVWAPRRRRGPKDHGWSEAERALKAAGVSRETQRLIHRLFAL